MALFSLKSFLIEEIELPAYVESKKRKLNRAFRELPPSLQSQLFILPEGGISPDPPYYQKTRLSSEPDLYVFFPAESHVESYMEMLKQKDNLEKEVDLLRNRFQQFVEKAPIPLVIVEVPDGNIQFVNKLFLEACQVPLRYLYENYTLPEYVRDRQVLRKVLEDLAKEGTLDRVVNVQLIEGQERHWLLRGYTYTEEDKIMALLGLIDITKEIEQEIALKKAQEELSAQQELIALNRQLNEAYNIINAQKRELEDSLTAAQRIQKALHQNYKLLDSLPVRVAKLIIPHSYLSGDFLWMQKRGDYVYLAVCDATGHGAAGALLATLTYALLSEALYGIEGPHQIHAMLSFVRSHTLKALNVDDNHVSAEGAEIVLAAFHEKVPTQKPVYLSGAGGRYVFGGTYYRTGRFGTGFYVPDMPAVEYTSQALSVQPGQWLWLFTDGIVDQLNPNRQKVGRTRLLSWLKQAENSADPENILAQALHTWRGQNPLSDDITLLGIQF